MVQLGEHGLSRVATLTCINTRSPEVPCVPGTFPRKSVGSSDQFQRVGILKKMAAKWTADAYFERVVEPLDVRRSVVGEITDQKNVYRGDTIGLIIPDWPEPFGRVD